MKEKVGKETNQGREDEDERNGGEKMCGYVDGGRKKALRNEGGGV